MTELGFRLKQARVAKGYTLEDVQAITKIQKRYLAGIEEGDYRQLPGSFYTRAFIRQYAAAVGLDPNALLEEHQSEMPAAPEKQVPFTATPISGPMFNGFAGRFGEVMPMLLVALFFIFLVSVTWFFYQARPIGESGTEASTAGLAYEKTAEREPAPPAAPPQQKTDESTAPEQPETAEPAEPEATVKVASISGEDTSYAWTGPASRKLTVAASGVSWVSVTDEEGKELMNPAREMQPGETDTVDITGKRQIRIRLGSTPDVSVAVNGKPIAYAQNRVTQNLIIRFQDVK